MQTSRAILNERKKKEASTFHKICTYEHPVPYFESEEVHGYEFSHIKTPTQQLIFHKQEVRPTPISLPTPPASPEFYGTSLQKWYQKKPLLTLTAKGQVKRLEKYLQIQRTLEICKREHEFQVQTQNMKNAYTDFEFREHQPLLYEAKNVCCVCPCNSSRDYDVDYISTDYVTCGTPQSKMCMCSSEDELETEPVTINPEKYEIKETSLKKRAKGITTATPISNSRNTSEIKPSELSANQLVEEEMITPTKIIKEGEKDGDDRGIHKIVLKNKDKRRHPENKYVVKLFDNENFNEDENAYYMREQSRTNPFLQMPMSTDENSRSFLMSKITLDHIASLPFDDIDERYVRTSNSGCFLRKSAGNSYVRYNSLSSSATGRQASCKSCKGCRRNSYREKYDMNKNEIM